MWRGGTCHSGTALPPRVPASATAGAWSRGIAAPLLGVLATAAVGLAQAPADPTFELLLADGTTVVATGLEGEPAKGLAAQVGGSRRAFAPQAVLAIHGTAVQPLDQAAAWLGGGDVVLGMLVGGDADGNHVTMLSPTLGSLDIAIDRLCAFVTPGHGNLGPAQLALPAGVGEAVFLPARVGFDLLAGSVHRFSDRGLRFAAEGQDAPRHYALADFVALRIADPEPRPEPPTALLLTRTGDKLGVHVRNFSATGVRCELEGARTVEVRYADLAALTFLGGAVFLSDLEPAAITESGYDGPAVHPWQRDRSAFGSALVAGGRACGKGLGVHARSRLEYRVPDGAARFFCRVAFDAAALGLPVVPSADARITVNGKIAFEQKGLGAGDPPRASGVLNVRPGDTIALEIDFGRGRDLGDCVDWLCPVFLPAVQ